jgi:phenylacetate-coenzyme A ligase PaaK-like adenylate-forming protein
VTDEAFTDFAPMRQRYQAELLRRAPEHVARLDWSPAQIAARQLEGLRALLAVARERSPFHARRLRAIDPDRFQLEDLRRLPVMTKSELMDDFDDALTDRRVTRALCERALAATTNEPRFLFDAYFCLSSGGSSGRRGVFVKDLETWTEFSLALNRSAMKRILAASGPPAAGGEVALIAAGSAIHCTGVARAWTAGSMIRFCTVPVTLPLPEMVERLNALQPVGLYGYPSVIARLAHEQREGRLRISPQSIRSTSENLLPQWRTAISETFGAPIIDTYGTTEGLVGVSEPDETFFTFNSDACILELVDDAGAPVPPGVASSRILVTNLANRIQPLIRYEIGDRFVRQPDSPHHGHLRARVEGRADEVLRFGEIEIHPLVIRSVLVKTPAVSDYQVRQTARGIEVTAQAEAALETEPLRLALISSLASAGLRDAEVEVLAVPVLERHEDTGKLRRFIAA